jgi:hypothetical protein
MLGKNRRPHTKEQNMKHAAFMQGRRHSEETKRKIGLGNKGKKLSEHHKRILRRTWIGRKHSEETKRKISRSRSSSVKHHFRNKTTGITEYFTGLELREKYSLTRYDTYRIISGVRKSAKGWEVV